MPRILNRLVLAFPLFLSWVSFAGAVPVGQSAPLTDASSISITGNGSNVPRTAGARAADNVNALDFSTLAAAAAQAATLGKPLRLPPGSYAYTGGTTLNVSASVIFEPGAVLSCSGANVSFTGLLTASRTQIFSSGCTPTISKISDAIYPEWWGATCSAGDDTTALQAAFNASGASTPRKVSIAGNCHVYSSISVSVSALELTCSGTSSGFWLHNSTAGSDLFQVNGVSNFSARNCSFGSDYAQGSGAVFNISNSGSIAISDSFFYGNSKIGTAIKLRNTSGIVLDHDWIQNVTGPCVDISGLISTINGAAGFIDSFGTISGGSGGTDRTYYNVALTGGSSYAAYANITVAGGKVTSVALTQQTQTGYKVGDVLSAASASIGGVTGFSVPVAAIGNGAGDLQMTRSRCDGAQGFAIGPFAGGLLISGNIFYANTTSAIYQTTSNIWEVGGSYEIVGNDLDTSPILDNTKSAIYMYGAPEVSITGNRIGYFAGTGITALYGDKLAITGNKIIHGKGLHCLDIGGAGTVTDFSITGNIISGCNYGLVVAGGGASNGVIDGNTFSSDVSYGLYVMCNNAITIGANANNAGARTAWGCVGQNATYYAGQSGPRLLAKSIGADMNTTADQILQISPNILAFSVTRIQLTNCTATPSVAAGGFYSAAGKSGTAIVPASQAYSAATSSSVIVAPALTSAGQTTRFTSSQIYFSLGTAQGSALSCDIYVYGDDLS